jgi:glutathione synthetase
MAAPPAQEQAIAKAMAVDWLAANGGLSVPPGREPGQFVHVPFALLPRRFERAMYAQAVALARPFNALVDAIARDPEWLLSTLRRAGSADPFTGRLLDLLELVTGEGGPSQPWALGLHRSDYMVDRGRDGAAPPRLRQIELNTISSSFASLSCTVCRLHAHLVDAAEGALLADPATPFLAAAYGSKAHGQLVHVPTGLDAAAMAAGLAAGVAAYAEGRPPSAAPPFVLFVVQPGERNVLDQRKLEHALRAACAGRVVVRRATLAEVAQRGSLVAGQLLYTPPYEGAAPEEVALVYFRAGYTPDDHPTEVEWSARALIERSCAVKCPNVAYHLAGTKKVQQALAGAGQVERFLPSPEDAQAVRACFAGLWSLDATEDSEKSRAALAAAKADPSGFVMKPQREGGGNNIYGHDIAVALNGGMDEGELAGFVLMERVFPAEAEAVFVRAGRHAAASALSELGIFGVYLGDGKSVRLNESAGHLLRTKIANSDEGGVAAGFAVLDTPFLVDA